MEKKSMILIVEDKDATLYTAIREQRPEFETRQANCSEAKEILHHHSPAAVIFNLDPQTDDIRQMLDVFHEQHPETCWILSAQDIAAGTLVEFMRLGISDFLKQPLNPKDLERLVGRIDSWVSKRSPQKHLEIHRTISLFSYKGGVGLSFLAVNTARALLKACLGRVLLVDFVLQHGNLAELLDITPQYTLMDLIENLERVDQKLLENSLDKHPSGLFILPCPKQPEDSEFFSSQQTISMLKTLTKTFNINLIDSGHELTTATIACLDHSDLILMVTTPDLPSLCNAKSALQTFKKMGYPETKVKLILNRWNTKSGIESPVIEKNLDYPIYHKIADEPALALNSINKGIPLHDLYKNEDLTKCFDKLAEKMSVELKKGAS